jgi:RNA polymerase sigma-70 factor, ECF subfamily
MKEDRQMMETEERLAGMAVPVTVSDDFSQYAEELSRARRIAAGDKALFRELYDHNVSPLYGLALRLMGNAAEAEDIVQEAFVRAYQKMNLFAGRSSLSSWLYRICLNVGLEHLRRRKGNFEDLNDANCGTVEPDQKSLVLKRKLEAAIRKLPDGCRAIFVLHDIEGFNHREIADRLNLAEGTSKSQLFKARAMMRRLLLDGRR